MNCKCQEISEKGKKDIENSLTIHFAAHESAMGREELHIKALIWVIVLLIVLLVGTNAGWLWYESTMETVVETTETTFEDVVQESNEGSNNIVGGDIIGETNN